MSTAFAFEPARRPAPVLPSPVMPVRPLATSAGSALPIGAPSATPAAAPLRAVARGSVPRIAAVTVVLAGVGCVLAAQLLLSVGTADGAYRLASLRQQSSELDRQQQVRTEQLQALAAPQRLAARATALGMVPDAAPAYLDARTGRVLGSAQPTR